MEKTKDVLPKQNIYAKLLEAKKEIETVKKNAKNPHFKNTYADLNALIGAVEPILHEKGLMLLQPIKDGKVYSLVIDCSSGEQLDSFIDLPIGGTPQAMGSAITYYRRYTLQSLLSLQAEDDDGQHASTPPKTQPTQPKQVTAEFVQTFKAKEPLNVVRFSKALDGIKKGLVQKSALDEFELTQEQKDELDKIK